LLKKVYNGLPLFPISRTQGGVEMLSKKELLIMSHFRKNARLNLTKISRDTGVPVSTIYDKLKKYESSIIQKHTALIDFQKIGFELRVNVLIKAANDTKLELCSFLSRLPNINSLLKVNNGFDFLVEGIFRNMAEVQSFYERIEKFKIQQIQEFFIIEDVKREAFLSDPDLVKMAGSL